MPIETDVRMLCAGRDPMVAAQDDDSVNSPWTDAWARPHDEVLLKQRSTHSLPVSTRQRPLTIALMPGRFRAGRAALHLLRSSCVRGFSENLQQVRRQG
jgi:hypothetical protein